MLPSHSMNLAPQSADWLLRLARAAIRAGLDGRDPGEPALDRCPPEILAHGASFVTLSTRAGVLRGCRGVLEPRRALAADVWHNAVASAFDDPRFLPIGRAEADEIAIDIAVLGPLEPVGAATEAALVAALEPGRHGLVLAWRGRRATFLPKVWESLREPAEFVAELKHKAGLPRAFWAVDVECHRYRTWSCAGTMRESADVLAP
jgi:AmmeMemoRadiSam system protein A